MNTTGFYKMVHLGPIIPLQLHFPDLILHYPGHLTLLLAQDL